MEWSEYLGQMASVVGSLTVVGGALIWIYKKLVSDPDKRMAEKIQRENTEALKQSIEPLTKAIDMLNNNLEESKKDRVRLNKTVDGHTNILNNHETRISVLEKNVLGVMK